MAAKKPTSVALLFAQFSVYHIDRCQSVARRLEGRAEVLAVEVATSSSKYAWEPSGTVHCARKITLFPGENYEDVAWIRKFWRQFKALRRCDTVFVGIGYNEPDIILLSWILTIFGVQVVLMSDSKFDDKCRQVFKEFLKSVILMPYQAAVVAGYRQLRFFHFLGFRRRPMVLGYDTVDMLRVRAMGGGLAAPDGLAYPLRDFVFVGRFVDKKNLGELLQGYARYVKTTGSEARKLVLIGAGPEELSIRAEAEILGVTPLIDFAGFLSAEGVAERLSQALALILPSIEEQWGLVVNEALAFGLPAIISPAVGAGDLLIRNLVNGYVIELNSPDGLATAMVALAGDEMRWRMMVEASHGRAWLGDTERLADAVEYLVAPDSLNVAERMHAMHQFLPGSLPLR